MVKTISTAAIERARKFVETMARPLDQAYLDYLLPSGPSHNAFERVTCELAKFQTSEGGFAFGIEPDLRTTAPTAIATSVALQFLRGINAPASLPVVKKGIEYLVSSVDREAWAWPVVDERVDEAPHAPWWNIPNLGERFRGFLLNPSAELLGYLYDYRALVPEHVLNRVEATVVRALQNVDIIKDAYELFCCMRLLHTSALPSHIGNVLEERLSVSLEAVDRDNPHLDLMGMVPTPSAFGYDAIRTGIERQAERLISSQANDGGWHPFWDWSEVDANAWREAEREWSGVLTRQAIVGLSAHHFIVE